jgi:hypothetical protein
MPTYKDKLFFPQIAKPFHRIQVNIYLPVFIFTVKN